LYLYFFEFPVKPIAQFHWRFSIKFLIYRRIRGSFSSVSHARQRPEYRKEPGAGSFARPLGEQQLTAVMTLLLLLAMLMTLMVMVMMMMIIRGGRGRWAGRGCLKMLMTHVIPAGRQVQVETGCGRVLATAGLGAGRVAAVASLLIGRQAHRRLRRVHGPRADERALHPAQPHAPFDVPTQMRERLGPGHKGPLSR